MGHGGVTISPSWSILSNIKASGMNTRPHILFICGQNQWRSPTAAHIYAKDQRIVVRSAGVSETSRRQVSSKDIEWSDLILVMEQKHKARLRDMFRDLDMPVTESLDIPDDYQFMDEELIGLIREGTEFHLNNKFVI